MLDKKILEIVSKLSNSKFREVNYFLAENFAEFFEVYAGVRKLQDQLESTQRDLKLLQNPSIRNTMSVSFDKDGKVIQ